jgi:hypothetical protein
MRVLLRRALFASVLLAAMAQGTEGGAPLETSRQELRKLQGGQKAGEAPSAKEGLRPSLPSLVTPGQESLPPPELLSPEKLEKERKLQKEREARKNWLVNGVQQLEKTDKAKEGLSQSETQLLPAASAAKTEEGRDPHYLLKLYDEQKKIETERQGDAKVQRAPAADPLAPFLQGWLGNSPARGQFFDEFSRKTETGPVGPAPVVGPATPSGTHAATPTLGLAGPDKAPAAAAPNPYLTELAPIRSSQPAPSALTSTGAFNPAANNPVFSPPVVVAPPPPAEVRQPERKAPQPPSADDKKYFPQLNRF